MVGPPLNEDNEDELYHWTSRSGWILCAIEDAGVWSKNFQSKERKPPINRWWHVLIAEAQYTVHIWNILFGWWSYFLNADSFWKETRMDRGLWHSVFHPPDGLGGGGKFSPPKISNSPKTQQTTMLCSGVNGAPLPLNLKFPPKSRGLDETLSDTVRDNTCTRYFSILGNGPGASFQLFFGGGKFFLYFKMPSDYWKIGKKQHFICIVNWRHS